MAKQAFAAYGIRVAPLRHSEEYRSVDNLDGARLELRDLVYGFLLDVQAESLVDDAYRHYFSVEQVKPTGRSIEFIAEYGRFGTAGSIKNVKTNRRTHQYGDEEAPVIRLRNLLVFPPRSDMAFLLAERYGGRGVSSMFLRHLKKSFQRRCASLKLRLSYEGLFNQGAWNEFLETAEMTQVKAVRYHTDSDIATDQAGYNIGAYTYSMKPVRGMKNFSHRLRDSIIHRHVDVRELMGLRQDLEIDETRVDLTNGSQQREWIINRDDLPILAYPLTDDEKAEQLADDEVYEAMRDRTAQLANEYNVMLPHGWQDGAWSKESLSVEMSAIR